MVKATCATVTRRLYLAGLHPAGGEATRALQHPCPHQTLVPSPGPLLGPPYGEDAPHPPTAFLPTPGSHQTAGAPSTMR